AADPALSIPVTVEAASSSTKETRKGKKTKKKAKKGKVVQSEDGETEETMMNFYFQILLPLLLLFLGVMFSTLTVSTTPLTSLATPVSYNATPQVHFYDSNLAADNQCPVVSTIGDFGSNLTAIVIDNTVNVLEEIDANGGVALD
ncbi:hypothetical protein ScalyP_jg4779, partial [Parmales sp. scaly parma]